MSQARLLIVDDDSQTRVALWKLFTRQGWQVDLASTVAEALERLDDEHRALILDLNLPDGGGEEVLFEVRRRESRTMVAVCSASVDHFQLATVASLRPELILSKPIDVGSLDRMCLAALAR